MTTEHQIRPKGAKEKIDDQKATMSRCRTNRIIEIRTQTRVEKIKAREDIHQEIQRRDHTIHDRDIKEPEECPKNAEARPRQTDHAPRNAR